MSTLIRFRSIAFSLWLLTVLNLAACAFDPAALTTPIAVASPTAIVATATPEATPTPAKPKPVEVTVIDIPLAGPIAQPNAEISGLAWYSDTLILLPQYPNRFSNTLFALPKQQIIAYLDGETSEALTPQQIPFTAPNLNQITGFEGFEAIAFIGDQIFLTIEARPGASMMGYLVRGEIDSDLSEIRLDTTILAEIEPQSSLPNFSDETLLVSENSLITIYEANGQNVNPAPVASQFDAQLKPLDSRPFPNIEYRITDATALDADHRFWVINYLFPGDIGKLNPAADLFAAQFGVGQTHASREAVERLIELQLTETGISLTDTPPLQLTLLNDDARNWEGLVRLPERQGFLLATDKFPETILGFVAPP